MQKRKYQFLAQSGLKCTVKQIFPPLYIWITPNTTKNKIKIFTQQKNKKKKQKLIRKRKPSGSCRRARGVRARGRWLGRWRGYRIGGRIHTWGGCGRTSTCQSSVYPQDWLRRCGTNRYRWTCSFGCRRWATCTPPWASASTAHHPLVRPWLKAKGFGWAWTSYWGPNPPSFSSRTPKPRFDRPL